MLKFNNPVGRLCNVQKKKGAFCSTLIINIGKTAEKFVIFLASVLKVYGIYLGCVSDSTNLPHGDIY